jgi:hypothetical protein
VIVMFAEMYADLRSLTRRGLLAESWWQRFADHEELRADGLLEVDRTAALVDALPLAAKIKIALGPGRAATVSGLAARLGAAEAQVRAAAEEWERLSVSPDDKGGGPEGQGGGKDLVVAWPAGQRAELRDPLTDAERSAPVQRFANRYGTELAGELARARQAAVTPVRVGTPGAAELMAEGGLVKWTLRADGTLWVSRPFGTMPDGELVEISHAVIGGGRDALAAGEVFLLPGGRAAAINVLSGHYHSRNSVAQNVRARAVGRVAFAGHGIEIPFDFVFADEQAERGGGFVALPGRGRSQEAVLAALPGLVDRMRPLEEMPHRMPRGPPGARVLVLDGELPVRGVIAFGWAERGVVVITRRMLDEIAGHLAAGRLDAGWWYGLLEHERDFHLAGAEHTGLRHAAHAARFAGELLLARACTGSWRSSGTGTASGP